VVAALGEGVVFPAVEDIISQALRPPDPSGQPPAGETRIIVDSREGQPDERANAASAAAATRYSSELLLDHTGRPLAVIAGDGGLDVELGNTKNLESKPLYRSSSG